MLPTRHGVGPSQVVLPEGRWPRLIDFLAERFPAIAQDEWAARMARGDVLDAHGIPVTPQQAYAPRGRLYYYRDVPQEVPNPAQATVLFEDELLLVADKPHFLPVIPSGKYLHETLLVRLKQSLALDELAPVHRIDRETAGLVLFAKQPATRARYAALFADRAVAKRYQAIAPCPAALVFPLVHRSRLAASAHFMQMLEVPGGQANTETRVEQLERRGQVARYALHPVTGRRHQLRVHMAALGMPILGDRIYPTLLAEGTDDTSNPLRLLAERMAFLDPVDGTERVFHSRRSLEFPFAGS